MFVQDKKEVPLAYAMTHDVEDPEPEVVEQHTLPKYLQYLRNIVPPKDSKWGQKYFAMQQQGGDSSSSGLKLAPSSFGHPDFDVETVLSPTSAVVALNDSPVVTAAKDRSNTPNAGKKLMGAVSVVTAANKLRSVTSRKDNANVDGNVALPHTPTRSGRMADSSLSPDGKTARDGGSHRSGSGTPTTHVADSDDLMMSPTAQMLAKKKKGRFDYSSSIASPITKSDFAVVIGPVQVTDALGVRCLIQVILAVC